MRTVEIGTSHKFKSWRSVEYDLNSFMCKQERSVFGCRPVREVVQEASYIEKKLSIFQVAVSLSIERGESILKEMGLIVELHGTLEKIT